MTRVPDPLIYSGKKRQETGTPCCGVIALLRQFDRSYVDRPLIKNQTVFFLLFLFLYYYVIASSANNMSNIVLSLSIWPFIIRLMPAGALQNLHTSWIIWISSFKFTVILCVLGEHRLIPSLRETRVITLGRGQIDYGYFFYHFTQPQYTTASLLSRINDHTQLHHTR